MRDGESETTTVTLMSCPGAWGAVLYLLSTIKQQLLEASGEQRSWSPGLEVCSSRPRATEAHLTPTLFTQTCLRRIHHCSSQSPHTLSSPDVVLPINLPLLSQLSLALQLSQSFRWMIFPLFSIATSLFFLYPLKHLFSCRVCRQSGDMCSNKEPHHWDGTTL